MKQPTDLVLINIRVERQFRTSLSIASKKLGIPVSEIGIKAFAKAIMEAAKKND